MKKMSRNNNNIQFSALESALDAVTSMVAIKDLNGTYIYANKAVNDHYKEKYDTIVGYNYKDIYPLSEQKVVEKLDNEVMEKGERVNKTISVLTDEGFIYVDSSRAPIFDENHNIIGVISVGQNVTERELAKKELKKTISKLEVLTEKYHRLSYQDELTKIWNRRKFYQDFSNLKDVEKDHVLIMIDLNNFKLINDQFGHSKGDELLKEFAEAIQKVAENRGGNAYRLGGDEFTLLYPNNHVSFQECIQALNSNLQSYHSSVSLSFGEIFIKKNKEIDEIHRDLCIKRADDLLYEYKKKYKITN
jgi:diguanylate cyclase (GGDEF)-like protein/PAS domain S-box-containing protein